MFKQSSAIGKFVVELVMDKVPDDKMYLFITWLKVKQALKYGSLYSKFHLVLFGLIHG